MHKSLHNTAHKARATSSCDAQRVPSTRYLRAHTICAASSAYAVVLVPLLPVGPSFASSVLSVINIYQQIRYSNTFSRIFARIR